VRSVKTDLPRFDGLDVLRWIFKAEQFFNYYNTPNNQHLIIVAIHLDNEMVPWFQTMTSNNSFQTCSDALLDCFIGGQAV